MLDDHVMQGLADYLQAQATALERSFLSPKDAPQQAIAALRQWAKEVGAARRTATNPQAIHTLETAIRFACNGIRASEEEAAGFRLALAQIRCAAAPQTAPDLVMVPTALAEWRTKAIQLADAYFMADHGEADRAAFIAHVDTLAALTRNHHD